MFKRLISIFVIVALAACCWADEAPIPRKPKPASQPTTAPATQPKAPAGE